MNEREETLYRQLHSVPRDSGLKAQKAALDAHFKELFAHRRDAVRAQVERNKGVHEAMRKAFGGMKELDGVRAALGALRRRRDRPTLAPPIVRSIPMQPGLRLGSATWWDNLPFNDSSGMEINVFDGPSDDTPSPVTDGTTGSMSFGLYGGGYSAENNSCESCWAGMGLTYKLSDALFPPGTTSAQLVFSATPSLSWWAFWESDWWRTAAGSLWFGQVVSQFDLEWNWISTPVTFTNNSLIQSWNDCGFADDSPVLSGSGSQTLSSSFIAEPNFIYVFSVCIAGDAYGEEADSWGWSSCQASMAATVTTMTFSLG